MSLFTKQHGAEIAKSVEENYTDFFPYNKTANAVQRSRNAWQQLANELNSRHSGANFNWTQVKDKYKNLKKEVKRQFAEEKKYKGGTGGGPSFTEPKDEEGRATKEDIIATFGSSASFCGVPGGSSTNIFGGSPLVKPSAAEEDEDIEIKNILKRKTATPSSSRQRLAVSPALSMAELQREVLSIELENQRKLSPLLDKMSDFIERASPLVDKMHKHFEPVTSHDSEKLEKDEEYELYEQQEQEDIFVVEGEKQYRKL